MCAGRLFVSSFHALGRVLQHRITRLGGKADFRRHATVTPLRDPRTTGSCRASAEMAAETGSGDARVKTCSCVPGGDAAAGGTMRAQSGTLTGTSLGRPQSCK